MTVWKYPLVLRRDQKIALPEGARVLHVGMQFDEPFMWVQVDPAAPLVPRLFRTFGTGHNGVCGRYVGTYLQGRGEYVWHVFEDTASTAADEGEAR